MSQSLVKNPIHIIWSTKRRHPFLEDQQIQGEMCVFLKGACDQMDCSAIKIGGTENHIHVLCHLSKNVTGAKLVGEIKRASSVWIKTKSPSYCGFFWQGGYSYFSVRPTDINVVVKYIANQKEHHRKIGFKDELRGFLDKYGIHYDEDYLWD